MTPRRSWFLLALVIAGWSLGVALESTIDVGPLGALLPVAGGAVAGLASVRLLQPPRRRGEVKYWRGRPYRDDEN